MECLRKFICLFVVLTLVVTMLPGIPLFASDVECEYDVCDVGYVDSAESVQQVGIVPLMSFPNRYAWVWPHDGTHSLIINPTPFVVPMPNDLPYIPPNTHITLYGLAFTPANSPMYRVHWNGHVGYVWAPHVVLSPPIPVQSVNITNAQSNDTIVVGNTRQLGVTFNPSQASWRDVTWSSSNQGVISVSPTGFIVAHSAGEAVISVRSACGNRLASVTFRAVVPVSNVSIGGRPTNDIMDVGDSVTLRANVVPGNATNTTVSWSSDDTSVATITPFGVLTARARGTSVISVRTIDGNRTASFTVTVRQPVGGISLCRNAVTLNIEGDVHESTTLVATITPLDANNVDVTWETSDSSVVSVTNDGVVRAVGPGSAQVIVRSAENPGIAAVSDVTVNMLVTDVELCRVSVRIPILGGVYGHEKISAIVSPSNASDKSLIWESSDPDVAYVDDYGNVFAVSPGWAIVRATSADGRVSSNVYVFVEG